MTRALVCFHLTGSQGDTNCLKFGSSWVVSGFLFLFCSQSHDSNGFLFCSHCAVSLQHYHISLWLGDSQGLSPWYFSLEKGFLNILRIQMRDLFSHTETQTRENALPLLHNITTHQIRVDCLWTILGAVLVKQTLVLTEATGLSLELGQFCWWICFLCLLSIATIALVAHIHWPIKTYLLVYPHVFPVVI